MMLVTDINLLANYLGILSLVSSVLAFSPAIIKMFDFSIQHKQNLAKIAKFSLIFTIFLGLIHGLLMTQKEDVDFYNLNTYWIYAEGLITLNLFILLAFTFTKIQQNIKTITYFTYAVLFLLGCHVWQQVAHFW